MALTNLNRYILWLAWKKEAMEELNKLEKKELEIKEMRGTMPCSSK